MSKADGGSWWHLTVWLVVKIPTRRNLTIESIQSIFEGKKTLEKHQIVNEKLKPEISRLHAFSQKTFTPAQWEKKQKEADQ